MFSKCEGCKLGPGGRTPFGIFWYSAYRPAFFFRGIKPSCNFFFFFFAENVLVRNCCLCVGVQKKWSRFVFVWLFFLFWLIFYLGTGLDFSLWAIQHPSKMPGGSGDGLSARIKSACFKGCCMGHVSPSRPCCDSI